MVQVGDHVCVRGNNGAVCINTNQKRWYSSVVGGHVRLLRPPTLRMPRIRRNIWVAGGEFPVVEQHVVATCIVVALVVLMCRHVHQHIGPWSLTATIAIGVVRVVVRAAIGDDWIALL